MRSVSGEVVGTRAFITRRGRVVKMMLHGDDCMMVCGRDEAAFMEVELKRRFTATVKVCGHETWRGGGK